MKKSTSFRLSNEALDALRELAEEFDQSQARVLENLIIDRHSVSDPQKNKARREWRIMTTEDEWEGLTPAQIFRRGYRHGWIDFQLRHGENELLVEI